MRLLRTALVTIGVIATTWLGMIAYMTLYAPRSHYNSTPPTRVTTHHIPDTDMSITLYVKQRPRAISYEGAYRVLELTRPNAPSMYFNLLPTSAGDDPNMQAYWYPATRCLKIPDTGFREGLLTSLVYVDTSTIIHLRETYDGRMQATKPESAMHTLQFPPANALPSFHFVATEVTLLSDDGIFVGTLQQPRQSGETANKAVLPIAASAAQADR